ncbi:MAG: hypothetical protein H3C35_08420 [Bacteroidetes bacterium]|nr:hypothetical protein [Bacteroidota bacterium]
MNETLSKMLFLWALCVERLNSKIYTKADDAELLNDICARNVLEKGKNELSNEQQKKLAEIDAEYKMTALPAITKAELLTAYVEASKFYPVEYWWWHVEER